MTGITVLISREYAITEKTHKRYDEYVAELIDYGEYDEIRTFEEYVQDVLDEWWGCDDELIEFGFEPINTIKDIKIREVEKNDRCS